MYKNALRRCLALVRKHMVLVVLTVIFALLSVAASLYIPLLIGRAVDLVVGIGQVEFDELYKVLSMILVSALVFFFSQYFVSRISNGIAYRIGTELREKAFLKINRLPLSYLDTRKVGDIVSRIGNDTDQFTDGFLLGFAQILTGLASIIGTLYFLLRVNLILSLTVLLLTPFSLFVASFIAKRTHRMFRSQAERRAEQTEYTDQSINSDKEIRCMCMQNEAEKDFERINSEWAYCSMRATFYSSLTNPCTRFVNSMVYAVVALAGGILALRGMITVGALTSSLAYAKEYSKPFNDITGVVTELQNALVCLDRVLAFIDEKEEDEIPFDGKLLHGGVAFEDVCFSYDPKEPLIEHFCLNVSEKSHVAIVGPTGSGKTTIINLLMRFYEPVSGAVKIGNIDISKVSRRSLRGNIGMVLQDTWIKNASVRENITMGRESTDEQVEEAARMAHADGIIRRLEHGYDTIISDSESSLSQGERQLLCLARIFLRMPDILVLDEATSNIDTRTELLIQDSFAKMSCGRTSFIVAHRLSTIENADLIIVLKDGRVEEMGRHEELLEKGGFYNTLYHSQFAHA